MEPEEYEEIEKYLNHELTDEKRQAFEKRMLADADFSSFVKSYISIYESLQAGADRASNEQVLKATLRDVSEKHFDKKNAVSIISMRNIYWAAAAAIFLAVCLIFIYNLQDPATYEKYAQHQTLALAQRSEGISELQYAAEDAFNNADYEPAAKYLAQLSQSSPDDNNLKLYWAIALIETSQYDKSDSLLTVISSSFIYKHTATWYQALSYLKQGKPEAAKTLLEKIPEGADKYDNAQSLLDVL